MIIQIYEIQTPEEAEACIELGVNRLGSVLLSRENWQSPLLREVMRLSAGTETRNSLIPLFQEPHTLFRALDYYRPQYIHFCETLTSNNGHEIDLEAFIAMQNQVKKRFPEIGIIRSIPIPRKGIKSRFPTLKIAKALEPFSDLFLTDTWLGQEPVEGFIGITGKTPDWDMAGALVDQSHIPVILAGGLSPENVYEAVRYVRPAGADSCTQTNQQDENGRPIRFKKDFKKVKAFVEQVRRAEKTMAASGTMG